MLNIFREYQLPNNKIVKCVTDSGSNFLKAFSEFKTPTEQEQEEDESDEECDYDFVNVSEILSTDQSDEEPPQLALPPHHACASHKLNLVCAVDIVKSRKASKLQKSAFAIKVVKICRNDSRFMWKIISYTSANQMEFFSRFSYCSITIR